MYIHTYHFESKNDQIAPWQSGRMHMSLEHDSIVGSNPTGAAQQLQQRIKMKDVLYKQVLLEYEEGSYEMAWIPEQFAEQDKTIQIGKLKRRDALVLHVYHDITLNEKQIGTIRATKFDSLSCHLPNAPL